MFSHIKNLGYTEYIHKTDTHTQTHMHNHIVRIKAYTRTFLAVAKNDGVSRFLPATRLQYCAVSNDGTEMIM